jgi:elongation factor G
MLEHRFKLNPEFYEPGVPYRETITKPVKTQYRHKKQSGGAGQYGEVYLVPGTMGGRNATTPEVTVRDTQEIELEWGGKLCFQNCIVGGVIDARFMPAILKGVMEKMENGPLSGCRARDIRVSVYDGSMHSVDSNEAAFKTAALMAFKKGIPGSQTPAYWSRYMKSRSPFPAEYMGDVMSDLSTAARTGSGDGLGRYFPESQGPGAAGRALPLCHAPAVHDPGQGYPHTQVHGYGPVPHEIQERIMKETAEKEEVS